MSERDGFGNKTAPVDFPSDQWSSDEEPLAPEIIELTCAVEKIAKINYGDEWTPAVCNRIVDALFSGALSLPESIVGGSSDLQPLLDHLEAEIGPPDPKIVAEVEQELDEEIDMSDDEVCPNCNRIGGFCMCDDEEIDMSEEDQAYRLGAKEERDRILANLKASCPECGGSGQVPGPTVDPEMCPSCVTLRVRIAKGIS